MINKYLLIIMILVMPYTSFGQEDRVSNLVLPVTYFVNHVKQLTLLKDNLTKYRQASIVGVSGIGKTQLARKYSHENRDNYSLIWFIDCNLDINEAFLKLAKSINRTTKSNLIIEDIARTKKEVMAYLTNKDKWLLVFDNLKVNGNYKVQEFINWEHNGNVVFCSQNSEILPNIVKMTAFEHSDSITLATSILENNDLKSAEFLAQEFAGYPVLIVQGVQLLNQVQGLDKKEYKKKIQQSTDKIKLNILLAIKELKPSNIKLLKKIALMNNQRFSKELLRCITDDKNTLDDDIYQLSKFTLISNIDSDNTNPIFEMHDVVAQKILEMNSNTDNKAYLEDIVTKLVNCIPKNLIKSIIFEKEKTVYENLAIIAQNAQKYNINIYKLMALHLQLRLYYMHIVDFSNSEKLIEWFNKADQEGKFKLWLMNSDEKSIYAHYLWSIGVYHKRCSDYQTAIKYFTKAEKISSNIKGYSSLKYSILFYLAVVNIAQGQLQDAEKKIQAMEQMLNTNLVDKSNIVMLCFVKTKLFFTQGKYLKALEQIDKNITLYTKNGLYPNDLLLTSEYILKANTLNALGRYKEAYEQAKQLYDIISTRKTEQCEVFGRIFIPMAKAELGLGKTDQALDHAQKAVAIFLADERRNPKDANYNTDPNLADSYVVQGDIFFALDKLQEAIISYHKAQIIYFYLYKDNSKNVAHVSYLYLQGAKAACKIQNLSFYKGFAKSQLREFGVDHPNSISMIKYCKSEGVFK